VINTTRNDRMILSVTLKKVIQSKRLIGLPRRLYCIKTKLERKLWSGFILVTRNANLLSLLVLRWAPAKGRQ
jgi:hypothetical protein